MKNQREYIQEFVNSASNEELVSMIQSLLHVHGHFWNEWRILANRYTQAKK